MRKYGVLVIFLTFFSVCIACAGEWNHLLCPGFSVPFYSYSFDQNNDMDSINGTAYGIAVHWVNYNKDTGFSFKCDGVIGINFANVFDGANKEYGTSFDLNFGVGYSFVRTPKVTFSLFATTGFALDTFNKEEDFTISGKTVTADHSFTLTPLLVGGDIYAQYSCNKKVGLYCNLAIKVPVTGVTSDKNEYEEKTNRKISGSTECRIFAGGYYIIPTIGISFKL